MSKCIELLQNQKQVKTRLLLGTSISHAIECMHNKTVFLTFPNLDGNRLTTVYITTINQP